MSEPGESLNPTQLLERASEAIKSGELLPPPKTWEEYAAGVVTWVALRWHEEPAQVESYRCVSCHSEHWVLGQAVGLASDARWPTSPGLGHGSFPYAQIQCRRCGHMRLLDLLKIFEPQQPWTP